jgi:hypothetical protein
LHFDGAAVSSVRVFFWQQLKRKVVLPYITSDIHWQHKSQTQVERQVHYRRRHSLSLVFAVKRTNARLSRRKEKGVQKQQFSKSKFKKE